MSVALDTSHSGSATEPSGPDGTPKRPLVTTGGLVAWGVAAAVLLLLLVAGSQFQIYVTGVVLIFAIAAVGLEWLMGRAGQVSLGNAAIMAVGAYSTAILAPKSWAPFPVPTILAAVFGAAIGIIIGIPALRLRGIYLALATLALQFIVQYAADRYQHHEEAYSGLTVEPPETFGINFVAPKTFVITAAVILGMVVLLLSNLYRHNPGRLWLSIKESELGAGALGINVTVWKMAAFAGSSAVVAVAGSLFGYYTRSVSSETFSLDLGISFVVMVIIGGAGSMGGAILGATVVTVAPYVFKALSDYVESDFLDKNVFFINNGMYGVLLLLFLLYRPKGIASVIRDLASWVTSRRNRQEALLAAAAAESVERAETLRVPGSTPEGNPLLVLKDVRVTYLNGAKAVDGVDLVVPENKIVALLGRNGAGKTSTLRSVSGFFYAEYAQVEGSLLLNGRELRGNTPNMTARQGVALVPERDKVFPSITTLDHLRLAAPKGIIREEIYDVFPRLKERSSSYAGLLSGGERQMLAMAMAWLLAPKLLLVDELSLGLAPVIVRDLLSKLAEISARDGIAVLLVEQNATAALSIAHYAYVLDSGVLVAQGTPDEIREHDMLSAAYVGGGRL